MEDATHSRYRSYEVLVNAVISVLILQGILSTRSSSTRALQRGPVYLKKHYKQFSDPKRKQETDAIVIGYHIAFEECQARFKWNRWNCTLPRSLLDTKRPVSLTRSLPGANKETAYVYAMVAAGVTFSLMQSCARGENNRCPCVVEHTKNNKTQRTCKENLDYAFKRAKRVMRSMDVKNAPSPERRLFNIKNFKAGIKTIQKGLPKVCRCHGISGACQQTSCWKSMPNIRKVSERLRVLYDNSVKVKYYSKREGLKPAWAIKDRKSAKTISLKSEQIVYLESSPNYCHSNSRTGHRGTLRRYCDPDNEVVCRNLCEGCGYRTVKRVVYERNCDKCRKQFSWCCTVSCGMCNVTKAQCMLKVKVDY